MGSLTDHTRPVENLAAHTLSDGSAILYTADTMGVIKVWKITKDDGTPSRWQSKLMDELKHHRTRINDMMYGNGYLWTGKSNSFIVCSLFPYCLQLPLIRSVLR